VGSWHDEFIALEDGLRANKASPASLMFHAATQSALAVKPHSRHKNCACVSRFSAAVCPHQGHLRLVFCGGTATSRPPCHAVLYCSWERNAYGLASRMQRFSPDFCATFFLADLLMLCTSRSSTKTIAWFLLL
jgi:hypothetical protein